MDAENYPTLSLKERDRRWRAVRDMMRALSLDCLIVAGFRSRERYESYITDDYVEGAVLLAPEGEPTSLTWTGSRISRAQESFSRGVEAWVTDYRVGVTGALAAAVIREKAAKQGRIGVVGLEARGPGETQGFIPYPFWKDLLQELPGTTFVEVSKPFAEIMLVKSEEEIVLIRRAAQIAESASQVMLETTRPGVGEEVIYAEILREIYRHGADARYPTLNLHSGPQNISWGPPRWISRAERPRKVQKGDMVQAEIFPCCGNQEVQVQMSVALDPIDKVNQRCEDVARRSYEAGLKALRPGITFAELVHAMEEPLVEFGCWAKTPLIHSLNPPAWLGQTSINMEQLEGTQEGRIEGKTSKRKAVSGGELVLRPGMTFAFEPNACIGTHRVNIGGALLVTETGCEELNIIPTRAQHVAS